VLKDKCDRYKKDNKVMHRPELENDSDFTIMGLYQLELIIRVMEKQFVEFPEPEQHRGLRASPTNGESALAPVSAA